MKLSEFVRTLSCAAVPGAPNYYERYPNLGATVDLPCPGLCGGMIGLPLRSVLNCMIYDSCFPKEEAANFIVENGLDQEDQSGD